MNFVDREHVETLIDGGFIAAHDKGRSLALGLGEAVPRAAYYERDGERVFVIDAIGASATGKFRIDGTSTVASCPMGTSDGPFEVPPTYTGLDISLFASIATGDRTLPS